MKKLLFSILCILTLFGCTEKNDASKPPNLKISVDGKEYNTTVGTYCWSSKCVDKEGPVDLLNKMEPLVVKANELITFEQLAKDRPDTIFLTQIFEQQEQEVKMGNYSFKAPSEVGTYYYGLSGTWFGKDKYEVSGDAQYAFALKIE